MKGRFPVHAELFLTSQNNYYSFLEWTHRNYTYVTALIKRAKISLPLNDIILHFVFCFSNRNLRWLNRLNIILNSVKRLTIERIQKQTTNDFLSVDGRIRVSSVAGWVSKFAHHRLARSFLGNKYLRIFTLVLWHFKSKNTIFSRHIVCLHHGQFSH